MPSSTWTPTAATGRATVRQQVRPDVAAGEYSWSLADSARLLEAGAVDCLQLDVTRCGGVTEFIRARRWRRHTTCRSPGIGALRPDPDRPGHGLTQRDADTERYRRG